MNFTYKEAVSLRNYYYDKMVGKIMENGLDYKVKDIQIDEAQDGTNGYWVRATHKDSMTGNMYFKEISSAAEFLKLESPQNVLLLIANMQSDSTV